MTSAMVSYAQDLGKLTCSRPENLISIELETYECGIHWQGLRKMNPFCVPFSILNMPGALLAMDLGFMGPNYPINTACATGNYCILS